MRDISAGRDIINSTITEIVGSNPSIQILQQPAEELAEAERLSRRVVRGARRNRAKLAVVFSIVTLVFLSVTALLGYYWLFQGGKLTLEDFTHDASNIALGALISTLASLACSCAAGALAYSQKDPTEAEVINAGRLSAIATRWEELRHLGFPKSEARRLRKQK